MYYSIAVYPHKESEASSEKWKEYIEQAAGRGFNEVFLSLHLPEFTLTEQLDLLGRLAAEAKRLAMCLTVDVGGGQLKELLGSELYSEQIRRAGVDFIRLDYGFTMEQAGQIWERWRVRGFVINASVFNREEFVNLRQGFRKIHEKVELRACHNYYPRPETGLSYEFFVRQNAVLAELGIPVYSCIPDDEFPRGPLGKGLPTVEAHRGMPLEQVVRQLAASPANVGLMAADEYFSEEKLALIRRTAEEQRARGKVWTLPVTWETGVTEEEKRIVCDTVHHIRYDSSEAVLRSQSSRQMSEYASQITPRSCVSETSSPGMPGLRKRGMVTIDNRQYGRYSGEVQIVKEELPADDRVNLVGRIAEEDMWMLEYYRYGVDYRFEAVGELRLMKPDDLSEMVALWNRNLSYCPIDGKEWAAVVSADENLDPELCLVAEEEGRIVGYGIGMVRRYPYLERGMEEGKAWILALVVDRPSRGKGIGSRLLTRLDQLFYQKGCRETVIASYSPYYFTAGVHESEAAAEKLLARHGYIRGDAAYWMERSLENYQMPEDIVQRKESLRKEGFAFIPYEASRAAELLEFLRKNFSTGWRVHVMRAMQQKKLEEHCILCCYKGRVAGYVQRGAGGDEYRFGPFGVAADFRNKGLGAVLLHLMWESMAQRGLDRVYFRSTEENGRRLYERHGMEVKEVYYHYSKKERS